MSRSWPRPTSTMLVPQVLVRNRPRRIIRCSSRPSADTREIRSVSASSSAAPQRLTAELTVCHTQPSSAATSLSGRPRPAWRVAHRAARDVNSALGGAISRAASVTVPAPQPRLGQRHPRLCHTSRTRRPNAGRSTSTTARSPSDHNTPPQPPHGGLAARQRTCTRNGPPPSSPTLSTSTSPSPTNSSHMRVGSYSTGILQSFDGLLNADSGGSLAFNRGPSRSSLRPQTRRAVFQGGVRVSRRAQLGLPA